MFISGDWRYLIFSQPTYGLGNFLEGGILIINSGWLVLKRPWILYHSLWNLTCKNFNQSVSFEIRDSYIFFGVGYNFDSFTKIKDEKLRLTPGDTLLTSHYVYNSYYGFNTGKYFSSALNLSLVYDTRDNMINPYKGMFATISWRGGLKILGNKSATNFTS
ncbi:MAG: BamA/TamA family outer membrane protein [Bacteroidales bacterium]|nr:BamA/TamA family outer membrane protein [Bacteroidales bacterium]